MNLKGSENWVKFLFSHKNRKTGLSCWFFFLKTKFKVQKTELWRVLFLEMFRLEFYNHIVSFCNWSKKLVKTPGEQLAFAETILNFHDFFLHIFTISNILAQAIGILGIIQFHVINSNWFLTCWKTSHV